MVHRAILGSVERMIAVLCEHTGGKWPFWLSPRQVCVVPVKDLFLNYANEVKSILHNLGYYVDISDSNNTLPKKVAEAQSAGYNFILVVGEKEEKDRAVTIRRQGQMIGKVKEETEEEKKQQAVSASAPEKHKKLEKPHKDENNPANKSEDNEPVVEKPELKVEGAQALEYKSLDELKNILADLVAKFH